MACYRHSTQELFCRSFKTPQELDDTRKRLLRKHQVPEKYLDKEKPFRQVWIFKLLDYCRSINAGRDVEATAVAYFQRYFLDNPYTGVDLLAFSRTCIFLATKTCESRRAARAFDVHAEAILALEPLLLHGLHYELQWHHPYIALEGFLLKWREFATEQDSKKPRRSREPVAPPISQEDIASIAALAAEKLHLLLYTDYPILCSPAQLALGALQCAGEEQANKVSASGSSSSSSSSSS